MVYLQRAVKMPLWLVFSGMGSQWAGMGAALMELPIFGDTIDRVHTILEKKDLDLKTILTETGPTAFDNILKSFVGITACQVKQSSGFDLKFVQTSEDASALLM